MHFYHIFGISKLFTGREFVSQKGITKRDFGSQNHLPDVNLALKIPYQTRIWPSNILTGHDFFANILCPDNFSLPENLYIFKTNVCPYPWPAYSVSNSWNIHDMDKCLPGQILQLTILWLWQRLKLSSNEVLSKKKSRKIEPPEKLGSKSLVINSWDIADMCKCCNNIYCLYKCYHHTWNLLDVPRNVHLKFHPRWSKEASFKVWSKWGQ